MQSEGVGVWPPGKILVLDHISKILRWDSENWSTFCYLYILQKRFLKPIENYFKSQKIDSLQRPQLILSKHPQPIVGYVFKRFYVSDFLYFCPSDQVWIVHQKFFRNWASWKEGSGFRSYQACSNCSSTGCDVWNYDLQGQAWFSDTCPGVQSLVFSCCCLASRLLWCRKPFNRRKMSLSRIDTEGKMTGLLGELSTLQTNMGPVKFPRATRYPIKEANTYLNPYVFLGRRLTSPVGV